MFRNAIYMEITAKSVDEKTISEKKSIFLQLGLYKSVLNSIQHYYSIQDVILKFLIGRKASFSNRRF